MGKYMTKEEIQRQLEVLQAMLMESDASVAEGDAREPSPEAVAQAIKNTEEGVKTMSDGIQNLLDKKEQETLLSSIRNLMANLKLSLDQAMDALGIPQDKRSSYAGLIKNS